MWTENDMATLRIGTRCIIRPHQFVAIGRYIYTHRWRCRHHAVRKICTIAGYTYRVCIRPHNSVHNHSALLLMELPVARPFEESENSPERWTIKIIGSFNIRSRGFNVQVNPELARFGFGSWTGRVFTAAPTGLISFAPLTQFASNKISSYPGEIHREPTTLLVLLNRIPTHYSFHQRCALVSRSPTIHPSSPFSYRWTSLKVIISSISQQQSLPEERSPPFP